MTTADAISLLELNHMVRDALSSRVGDSYWVRAEISEARHNPKGHLYLTFIEKNEAGQNVAQAKGVIWAQHVSAIEGKFFNVTGRRIDEGIKVMVRVRVNFHELYGLSLYVSDIDPAYTLGDIVRRRREILAHLERDGVAEMNKGLPLPRPLLRIAVITSATAAGYGDFCNHLRERGAGFRFKVKLFPAVMQGVAVESTVIAALNRVAEEAECWDAVAIIRGGGAKSDLDGFESYALATNVAQFVMPVITGIGHERDETVVDLVACVRCKTPTAVADFLVERAEHEKSLIDDAVARLGHECTLAVEMASQRLDAAVKMLRTTAHILPTERDSLEKFAARLSAAFAGALGDELHRQERMMDRLRSAVAAVCSYENARCGSMMARLAYDSRFVVSRGEAAVAESMRSLARNARSAIALERSDISAAAQRLQRAAAVMLRDHRQRLEQSARSVRIAGPERILSMGFSITRVEGHAVRSVAQLKTGDLVVTQLSDGEVRSRVEEKQEGNS